MAFIVATILGVFIYPFYNPEKRNDGKLDIAVSFYPPFDIVRNIAGDVANVHQIIPFGTEPHSFEPTPKNMITIFNSELFIYSGEHVDLWASEIAETSVDRDKFLNLSKFVEVVDEDPHFWLDFSNFKNMVMIITEKMVEAEPEYETVFERNRDLYLQKFEKLENDFKDGLAECKLDSVIVNHNAFQYLAKNLEFQTIAIMGLSPEEQPSAKKLSEIADLVKEKNITTIFFEELAPQNIVNTLSSETGVSVSQLSPLGNIEPDRVENGYIELMYENLQKLQKGLLCK
jgi:zinc transport system substrate-binding protein